MTNSLINTADLKALVESKAIMEAVAKPLAEIDGYFLHITTEKEMLILSTYLSDKPRLFRRSDALLKEAQKLGLKSLRFDFK